MSVEENRRISILKSFAVYGTESEPAFDRLARLASHVAESPTAWICFHGNAKQWVKANDGHRIPQGMERDHALCSRVVRSAAPVQVPDLDADRSHAAELARSQLGARSYAGVPILADGYAIGSIGTLNPESRSLDTRRERMLADLAEVVVTELRLRNFDLASRGGGAGAMPGVVTGIQSEFYKKLTQDHLRILQAIDNAVIGVNRNQDITFLNRAAETMLARPAEALIGQPLGTIRPDRGETQLDHTLKHGEERFVRNQYFVRGDNTTFPVEIVASPMRAGTETIGTMLVCRDASNGRDIQGLSLRKALKEIERLKIQIAKASDFPPLALSPVGTTNMIGRPQVVRDQQLADMFSRLCATEIDQIMRAMALAGHVIDGPTGAAAFLNIPAEILRTKLASLEKPSLPKPKSRLDRWATL